MVLKMLLQLFLNSFVPWFKCEKNAILKVKSRWLQGNEKATAGGVGDINMKEYDYEGTKGYYVNNIAFK